MYKGGEWYEREAGKKERELLEDVFHIQALEFSRVQIISVLGDIGVCFEVTKCSTVRVLKGLLIPDHLLKECPFQQLVLILYLTLYLQ